MSSCCAIPKSFVVKKKEKLKRYKHHFVSCLIHEQDQRSLCAVNSLFTSTHTSYRHAHTLETILYNMLIHEHWSHNRHYTDGLPGTYTSHRRRTYSHTRPTLLTGTDRSVNGPPGN